MPTCSQPWLISLTPKDRSWAATDKEAFIFWLFFLLECEHLKKKKKKRPIWIGATANFTYPFIFNEPILFYGCFKRTDREEVAINGKHEATCWDFMVRLMACLVMPLQTNISIIPFSNTDQNSKEKRKILAPQNVNMKEYFQGVWGRCSHQHSNS